MQYRREIDGIRALAVLPVILFHTGWHRFDGGFVGVDIFFVISGYLITSIIVAEHEKQRFSIVGFYERRARRIMPALFAVIFLCLPFAWVWLLPSEMKDFSQSLIAVPGFVSNVLFYLSSGYFETETAAKPLLHTWSLAVEEQYYLLFPLALALIWRYGRKVSAGAIAVAGALSLLAAQWGVKGHPSMTFYLPHTRAWELLLGSLTAIYLLRNDNPRTPKTQVIHEGLAFFGISLIIWSIAKFDANTPSPSLYTLLPTVGTALLILFADKNTFAGRALGAAILVRIGLISYSAYLWHQPLFAFARQRSVDAPSKPLLGLLALASLGLAYVTWKFVELPFRQKERFDRKQIFVLTGSCSALIVAVGVCGLLSNGFSERQPFVAKIEATKKVEDSRCHMSLRRTPEQISKGDLCVLGAKGTTPTFAIIGDSHAGALFEGVDKSSSRYSFYAVSGGWCAPLMNGFDSGGSGCMEMTRETFKQLASNPAVRDVFLVAEWALYTKGFRETATPALYSDNDGKAQSLADNPKVFARSLKSSIDSLRHAGKNVTIIGPVPEFDQPVINTISKHILVHGTGNNGADLLAFAPKVRISDYRARNAEVFDVFKDLHEVDFIDTERLYCQASSCSSVSPAGVILFSDTNHVTEDGSRAIADKILEKLAQHSAGATALAH